MCGIAGLLGIDSQSNIASLAHKLQTHLAHRGPDDNGIYVSEDHQNALIHTRLAILDLSPAGHQPMSTADGRYWVTFNGEIYNYRELRSQLQQAGDQFISHTDTEVILKLYQRQGKACIHSLRGMFAFAIWDNQEKSCFLARDPLGIKPLYYWQSGSTLIFASEMKAILATGLPSRIMSEAGLYGYLLNGSVPEPHTLIQSIYALEAGHWLDWKAGKVTQQQYWQINFLPRKTLPAEATNIVRQALIDSVKSHLVSDVPIGIFLSGGIDSSLITAIASKLQPQGIKTYSIAFEEANWNEGDIASQVAQYFGTQHLERKISAEEAKDLFSQYLKVTDQPSVDGFNTFCVAQVAYQDGIKVVLSGLGGDELFGGYNSFRKVPFMLQISEWLNIFQPCNKYLDHLLSRWSKSPKLRRLGDFIRETPTTTTAYTSFRGIFSHYEAFRLMQQYVETSSINHLLQSTSTPTFQDIADEISFLEISRYMRNQLLRDSDVMSMAWGLELRVPLVDKQVLEAISIIPSSQRLAIGKQLLIEAFPELPDWLINRPKKGFSFPFDLWLRKSWQELFDSVRCPSDIPLKPWYRRWSLMALEYWYQEQINQK